jgi:uncharacterized protein with PIN domain
MDELPHERTPQHCPSCKRELEQGTAVLVSGMIPGAAYYCPHCRMLYAPDLAPLARMVG